MIITIFCRETGGILPEEAGQFADRPVHVMPELEGTEENGTGSVRTEPRLREVAGPPAPETGILSRILRQIAWLTGIARTGETRRQARARARDLVSSLTGAGEDCVLVAPPVFLGILLAALRRRGFVVRRTAVGRIRAGEKLFLSQRKDHCGGCSHNCLLQNPGCDVGRDKARRGHG